jgi:hypothetical protein
MGNSLRTSHEPGLFSHLGELSPGTYVVWQIYPRLAKKRTPHSQSDRNRLMPVISIYQMKVLSINSDEYDRSYLRLIDVVMRGKAFLPRRGQHCVVQSYDSTAAKKVRADL